MVYFLHMNYFIMKRIAVSVIIVLLAVAGIYVYYTSSYVSTERVTDSLIEVESSFNVGSIDQSIETLEEMLRGSLSNENRARVLLALATLYTQQGSLSLDEHQAAQKAISLVQESLSLNGASAEAYRILGYAYEITEQYNLAEQYYMKSLEVDSRYAIAHSNLGHMYDLKGDWEKAQQYYASALTLEPELDHALLNSARLAIRLGDVSGASILAAKVTETSRNNRFMSEAYNILGIIALQQGAYSSAISSLEKGIAADASLAQNYVALAQAHLDSLQSIGDAVDFDQLLSARDSVVAKSTPLLTKALEINPQLASAYLLQARVLSMAGDMTSAQATLNQGLSVIDADITLGAKEKEAMRINMQDALINYKNTI